MSLAMLVISLVVAYLSARARSQYLLNDYLVWWEREMTVEPANPDDAHRRLEKGHNLVASLSHVETRQVRPDYTLRWDGKSGPVRPRIDEIEVLRWPSLRFR